MIEEAAVQIGEDNYAHTIAAVPRRLLPLLSPDDVYEGCFSLIPSVPPFLKRIIYCANGPDWEGDLNAFLFIASLKAFDEFVFDQILVNKLASSENNGKIYARISKGMVADEGVEFICLIRYCFWEIEVYRGCFCLSRYMSIEKSGSAIRYVDRR